MSDPVNHPPHYGRHPSGVECIDIVEHMNFNRGNAIKYLWRAGEKDTEAEIQDLRKARWYVAREIERLMGEQGATPMRLVILESPFAASDGRTVSANVTYARRCLRDSLMRGEAPMASHLLYTQPRVLDDSKPEERLLGILAGLAWGASAKATVVYTDHGISEGMTQGIRDAEERGRPVEFREIDGERK